MPHYFDSALSVKATVFYHQLVEKRQYGVISCAIQTLPPATDHSNPQPLIAELIKKLGFVAAELDEIEQNQAHQTLRLIISHDLAYDTEIMSQEEADQMVEGFLAFFEPSLRYFTNGYFTETPFRLQSWNPLTAATFDTGVVVLSKNRIGLLWAEDED